MSYDMAFLGSPTRTDSSLSFDGTAVEGIYKLVQQVMVLLFKDENSVYAVNQGTALPQQLIGSNVIEEDVLKDQFSIAGSKVMEQLVENLPADTPDDEYPESVVTRILSVDGDEINVEVTIEARSGDATSVKFPVSSIPEES